MIENVRLVYNIFTDLPSKIYSVGNRYSMGLFYACNELKELEGYKRKQQGVA